jgi:hypothetical protein
MDIDYHQAKNAIFEGQLKNASTKQHYILCGTIILLYNKIESYIYNYL